MGASREILDVLRILYENEAATFVSVERLGDLWRSKNGPGKGKSFRTSTGVDLLHAISEADDFIFLGEEKAGMQIITTIKDLFLFALGRAEEKRVKAQKAAETARRECDAVREEKASLVVDLDSSRIELMKASEAYERTSAELVYAKEALEAKCHSLAACEQDLSRGSADLLESRTEVLLLKKQVVDLEGCVEAHRLNAEIQKSTLEQLQSDLTAAQKTLDAQKLQFLELQKALQAELSKARKDCDDGLVRIDEERLRCQHWELQLESQRIALEQLQDSMRKDLELKDANINDLRMIIKSLNNQVTALQEDNLRLSEDRLALEKRIAEETQQSEHNRRKSIEILEKSRLEATRREEEAHRLKSELDALVVASSEANSESRRVSEAFEDLQRRFQENASREDRLTCELEVLKADYGALLRLNAEKERALDHLQRALSRSEKESEKLQYSLRQSTENFEEVSTMKEVAIHALAEEIQKRTEALRALSSFSVRNRPSAEAELDRSRDGSMEQGLTKRSLMKMAEVGEETGIFKQTEASCTSTVEQVFGVLNVPPTDLKEAIPVFISEDVDVTAMTSGGTPVKKQLVDQPCREPMLETPLAFSAQRAEDEDCEAFLLRKESVLSPDHKEQGDFSQEDKEVSKGTLPTAPKLQFDIDIQASANPHISVFPPVEKKYSFVNVGQNRIGRRTTVCLRIEDSEKKQPMASKYAQLRSKIGQLEQTVSIYQSSYADLEALLVKQAIAADTSRSESILAMQLENLKLRQRMLTLLEDEHSASAETQASLNDPAPKEARNHRTPLQKSASHPKNGSPPLQNSPSRAIHLRRRKIEVIVSPKLRMKRSRRMLTKEIDPI